MTLKSTKTSFTAIGDCVVDTYFKEKKSYLGGTAYNLSLSANQAGALTSLISSIGNDSWGDKYIQSLHQHHISTTHLYQVNSPTSTINISLDKFAKPTFSNWKLGALKYLELNSQQKRFLSTQSAAIVILYKPIAALFKSFYNLQLPHTLKAADFSGDSDYSQSTSTINEFTQNLDLIIKSTDLSDKKSLELLQKIAAKQNKICLALLGKNGSTVFSGHQTYHQPAIYTQVKDTTGAGDAYIATFIVKYLQTNNLKKSMLLATQASIKTISHQGASL